MKFYFPDSQDQVNPNFNFVTERHADLHRRQRDDRYAHEFMVPPPYGGLLVSKAMIDRYGNAGRYTAQQRHRFYREGVRKFFRLDNAPERIETLGDCGAFSYIDAETPPYSTDEVIDFYEAAGVDAGVSVDHLIPSFDESATIAAGDSHWQPRFDLTLRYASEFFRRHRERGATFEPVGVAQGWSPESYAHAVVELEDIGYERIAIGGLVPLKTDQIHRVLTEIGKVRRRADLHLFGVTRLDDRLFSDFTKSGVTSFDTTSPFRQAFKDATDNYYVLDGSFMALRVPQVEGNAKFGARIRSGQVDQRRARELEQEALRVLRGFNRDEVSLDDALGALCEYQELWNEKKSHPAAYRRTLEAAPWRTCDCTVCKDVGIEVAMFRGSERNKRRGFHNMHVFAKRLERAVESHESRHLQNAA
jgi:hypothetical protein